MLKYSHLAWIAVLGVAACQAPPTPIATAPAAPAAVAQAAPAVIDSGTASYYGKAHNGRRTASGEHFNMEAMTAAHPWLPFGTKVRVTVQGTDRSIVVTITDRLPSHRRIIDLSQGAARELGIIQQGLAEVVLTKA
jgi:rare lipoprotein A